MLLYRKIMNQLIWEIKAGKYPVGSSLPCERELAKCFGSSQKSIHNAMCELVRRGFVESRHGSGNYILSCAEKRQKESIAIVMNCSKQRSIDDFFAIEAFMNQIGSINSFARKRGVSTELLIYQTDEPLTDKVQRTCKTQHFLNIFFTADPELVRTIRRHGGVIQSVIFSFHEKDFLARYPGVSYVMCNYTPGIAKAFSYFKAAGFDSFSFFAQGLSGKANYRTYAQEAEKAGLRLLERHFKMSMFQGQPVYSGRRVAFFRRALKKLPAGTVIFSDGSAIVAELLHSMAEKQEYKLLTSYEFCLTGDKGYWTNLFEGLPCHISWISAASEVPVLKATETLLDNLQDGKPVPEKIIIETVFDPYESITKSPKKATSPEFSG